MMAPVAYTAASMAAAFGWEAAEDKAVEFLIAEHIAEDKLAVETGPGTAGVLGHLQNYSGSFVGSGCSGCL